MSTAERPQTVMGSVVLHDISWEQYNGLVEAMGDRRFRHTHNCGTLEIFGEAIAGSAATRADRRLPPVTKEDEQAVVLYDVMPEQYRGIMEAMGDHRLRHSYNHWTLEIMSPSATHEWENRFIQTLLPFIAVELGVEIKSLGSWTLKPSDFEKGIEPDSCFYIANEPKVRFRKDLDLENDPPPDLAVVIDVSHTSLGRIPIYVALGVPELWRYDGNLMQFLQLQDGAYVAIDHSVAFPFLPAAKLQETLADSDVKTDIELVKDFVAWLRENRPA